MKALLQRVTQASVTIDDAIVGEIGQGLVVLLGVQRHDAQEHADKLLHKILHYRVFNDENGKMNLSVQDIRGGVLLISQFTLAAETQKGLRPGFSTAAPPAEAEALYDYTVRQAQATAVDSGVRVATGRFGADMQVQLINDGPVTFMLDV